MSKRQLNDFAKALIIVWTATLVTTIVVASILYYKLYPNKECKQISPVVTGSLITQCE